MAVVIAVGGALACIPTGSSRPSEIRAGVHETLPQITKITLTEDGNQNLLLHWTVPAGHEPSRWVLNTDRLTKAQDPRCPNDPLELNFVDSKPYGDYWFIKESENPTLIGWGGKQRGATYYFQVSVEPAVSGDICGHRSPIFEFFVPLRATPPPQPSAPKGQRGGKKRTGGAGLSKMGVGGTVSTQAKPKRIDFGRRREPGSGTLVLDERSRVTLTEDAVPGEATESTGGRPGKNFTREFRLWRGNLWYTTYNAWATVNTSSGGVHALCSGGRRATFTVELTAAGTRVRNYGSCQILVSPRGDVSATAAFSELIPKGAESLMRSGRRATSPRSFTLPKKPFWRPSP